MASTETENDNFGYVTYRRSHKIGLIALVVAVAIIMAANAAVIAYFLIQQNKLAAEERREVTLSPVQLEKLGMNQKPVGDTGSLLLEVGPDTEFKGRVDIAGDMDIAGKVKAEDILSAPETDFKNLKAGDAKLNQLNVDGGTTLSDLFVRENVTVEGPARLQGTVTISQLLTVDNNVNISNNLSVDGTLSASQIRTSDLVSRGKIKAGGHIISGGGKPTVSPGPALGSGGTASISGNDTAGTVQVSASQFTEGGIVARVNFRNTYPSTPYIAVTSVDRTAGDVYVQRNAGGFSIGVDGTLEGGYAFDYIVLQ